MKKHILSIVGMAVTVGVGVGTSSISHAQSTLTLYGIADAGLDFQRGGPDDNLVKLASGMRNGSRFGIKGKEDLGGGLAALLLLESGFSLSSGASLQSGRLFGRQTYTGLSGNFGTVTLGRQYSALNNALCAVDPFGCGLAGDAVNLMSSGGTPTNGGNGSRINNALMYATPPLGGLMVEANWGFGEVAGNTAAARTIGGAIGYVDGPTDVRLSYNAVADATGERTAKVTLLGAKYTIGQLTWHAAYAINKGAFSGNTNVPKDNDRDLLAGISVQIGDKTLLASYIRTFDRSGAGNNARQWALGYLHPLSARTSFYTAWARISNSVANTAGNSGGFYTVGNASSGGIGNSALNIGVRHLF